LLAGLFLLPEITLCSKYEYHPYDLNSSVPDYYQAPVIAMRGCMQVMIYALFFNDPIIV